MTEKLILQALRNIPLIKRGDDLVSIISGSLQESELVLEDGDILVLAQKIVSKATGCLIDLRTVTPGEEAIHHAQKCGKDPRLVEAILSESKSVVRNAHGVLITEHRLGWIMANAGIDASNVDAASGDNIVLKLPQDPDGFCEKMRGEFYTRFRLDIGVLINDSFGRPFRIGTTGVALGAAGLPSLWDRRGEKDLFGRALQVSQQAVADELASAASLLQGQAAEGCPVVLVRGLEPGGKKKPPASPAADLVRGASEDLFR